MVKRSARSPAQNSASFSGPYERWMLEFGQHYDLPALRLQDSPYISHVAEFTGGFKLPTVKFNHGLEMSFGRSWIKVPPLWNDHGNFETAFLPLIEFTMDEKKSAPVRLKNYSFARIEKMNRAFAPAIALHLGFGGNQKKAKNTASKSGQSQNGVAPFYYRMNFPLVEATVDHRPLRWNVPKLDSNLSKKPSSKSKPKQLVITAIIDDGIPFAHANFRYADKSGTRIDFCWSQSAAVNTEDKKAGTSSTSSVLFGREFTGADINAMVKSHGGDENAIYRAAGLLTTADVPSQPLSQMHSHGAHVLDSFSGNWSQASEVQSRIIAVDLPSSASWDTSGYGKDMFVLSAMHYIFKRADDLAKAYNKAHGTDMPVRLVINLSYGFSGGPHNGTNLVEAALHEMIEQRRKSAPTVLVMPSGNTFIDSLHAVIVPQHFSDNKGVASLKWMVQPDDQTSSYLEIWLPENLPSQSVEIALKAPDGSATVLKAIKPGNAADGRMGIIKQCDIKAGSETAIGRMTLDRSRGGKMRFLIALAPTAARASAGLPSAPSGIWTVQLTKTASGLTSPAQQTDGAESEKDAGIQCFIQRDVSFGQGNTGARQSYFIDPQDIPFNAMGSVNQVDSVRGLKPGAKSGNKAMVRRFGTINGMATAGSTLVVGGFVDATQKAAAYSSAGALRYKPKGGVARVGKAVNASALVERNQWARGVVAAGTRSGITVAFQGTSSASPQVARVLAEVMLTLDEPEGGWNEAAKTNYIDLLGIAGVPPVADHPTAHPASKDRLGSYLVGGQQRNCDS